MVIKFSFSYHFWASSGEKTHRLCSRKIRWLFLQWIKLRVCLRKENDSLNSYGSSKIPSKGRKCPDWSHEN